MSRIRSRLDRRQDRGGTSVYPGAQHQGTTPSLLARDGALGQQDLTERTPSFWKVRVRCDSTVFGLTERLAAISVLVDP